MYANIYCVHNVHNSSVVNRGGGGYLQGLPFYFLNFHIQKGVLSNNRCKIKDQNRVTMLKHNIIYKWCLMKYNKSRLKCLKLLALFFGDNSLYIAYENAKVFISHVYRNQQ